MHHFIRFLWINRISESRYQGYVKVGVKHYKVPMFCSMPKEIFGHLYKYDYADLRYQVENTDFNSETISTLHSAVIALISAYDISNESELLEIAETMLNKMYEVDSTIIYAHINEWQIMKRKNVISDDEINKMKDLRVRTKFWTTIGLRKEPFYVFKRTKGYCTTDISSNRVCN